jgi:hypothetical protein
MTGRPKAASRSRQKDVCQSCGMPLSLDERRSVSANEYCSHCWRGRRFVMPDLIVEQMQARISERLRQVGVPEPRVRSLVRRISSLGRWRQSRLAFPSAFFVFGAAAGWVVARFGAP